MDLFRSDGISQGNMARAGAEQASAADRLEQKDKVDRLNKNVLDLQGNQSKDGEAATMKGIADGIVGGLVGTRVTGTVNQFRKTYNAAQVLKAGLQKAPTAVPEIPGKGVSASPGSASSAAPAAREPTTANMTFEQKQAYHNPNNMPPSRTQPTVSVGDAPEMQSGAAGKMNEVSPAEPVKAPTPASESAPNPLKSGGAEEEVSQISEEGAGKAIRFAGAAGGFATGAMNLDNDLKAGSLGGKNSNWEQKVGDVFQMGGSVADVAGVFNPLAEVVGLGAGLIGSIFKGIGDSEQSSKKSGQDATAVATAKSAAAKQQSIQPSVVTPIKQVVSYGRSV